MVLACCIAQMLGRQLSRRRSMLVVVWVAMGVRVLWRVGLRQQVQMPMPDTALADDAVREGADIAARPTQHGHLQAFVPVEMDM